MSNLAADWLLHGIAAARANEKTEARTMLEHALIELDVMAEAYGQIDEKARSDAWYWLSYISDDPKQKRDLLENVLASNPSHPEARRDLAILDGRLKPGEMVDPNRAAAPVVTSANPDTDDVRCYVCPQCGGKLAYDVESRALVCDYCGYRAAESESGAIAERDFVAAVYTARAHCWELPAARTLSCQSCGARFVVPPAQRAGNCPFCDSVHIVESAAAKELIEPGGIVPFQFDQTEAIERIRRWLAERHRDKGELKQARLARPRPIYFPFWTFNMGGELRWRGMVQELNTTDGQMDWVPRDGSDLTMHDDLLVPASHSLPNDLTSALSKKDPRGSENHTGQAGYALDALVPYADSYLADWPAELYQIPLANASLVARQRSFELARDRIQHLVEARGLSFDSTGILINSYKLVLLPVWVCELHLKEQLHPIAVNGQTGAIHGRLPESGLRGWLSNLLGG